MWIFTTTGNMCHIEKCVILSWKDSQVRKLTLDSLTAVWHCLLCAYAQNLIPWASPLGGLTTSEDCHVLKLIVGEPSGDPTWYAVCYAQTILYVQFNQDSIKIYKQSKTKSLHDIPTCDFARRVLLKSNQPSFIIFAMLIYGWTPTTLVLFFLAKG